ncbi:hypothetical protein PAMP_009765 [Pampus punctatissimus]
MAGLLLRLLTLSLLHPSLMRVGGRIRTLSREALFQLSFSSSVPSFPLLFTAGLLFLSLFSLSSSSISSSSCPQSPILLSLLSLSFLFSGSIPSSSLFFPV